MRDNQEWLHDIDYDTRIDCIVKYIKDGYFADLRRKGKVIDDKEYKIISKHLNSLIKMMLCDYDGVEEDVLDCIGNEWADYLNESDYAPCIEDLEEEEYVSNVINPFINGSR